MLLAIEAVLDIACRAGDAPLRVQEFTDRQGVPKRYLEPVLQDLVHAGILSSVRGPRGGYRLGRNDEEITLADIITIVRNTEDVEEVFSGNADQSPLGRQLIRPLFEGMVFDWMKQLQGITIGSLRSQAQRQQTFKRAAE
jgi:Rrf2 family iron-sulfur cluster assembly transcriptional regulator